MSAHTPGPSARNAECDACRMLPAGGDHWRIRYCPLHAAAPALLEALAAAQDALALLIVESHQGAMRNRALGIVSAAIAKAKGETA